MPLAIQLAAFVMRLQIMGLNDEISGKTHGSQLKFPVCQASGFIVTMVFTGIKVNPRRDRT